MRIITLTLSFVLSIYTSGQMGRNFIGVKPYIRWDRYPEFSYNYMGRASTNYLKMQGVSPGVDLYYAHKSCEFIYQLGVGCFKSRFDKLNNRNTDFGVSDSRIINYPSLADPIYVTDKYSYNIISFNIEVKKEFWLKEDMSVFGGVEINNFLTYSQTYNIKSWNKNYRVNERSWFGRSFQLITGIAKQYQGFSIAPILTLPVYTTWQKDDVFNENEEEKRSKWLNGLSIGLQFDCSIKK